MGFLEVLGLGVSASGWIAAFVTAVYGWRRTVGLVEDRADLRDERRKLTAELISAKSKLAKEKTENANLRAETVRLTARVVELEEREVDRADAGDLGDLSSRGVREDAHGREDDPGRGPVPSWLYRDPGDSGLSGGGS